ncbi:hypothetical protein ASC89_13625 [Devosia sp. Root413D1]|uniref:hypothetical protein n=1 Tax=Devosia sp. Root413D1 TaxID=1736531 RepID=UPI0006F66AE9|nr:hypothetical protein [Devosia sp. Root413D1]KQW79324.1 hypothetical protein ASC89_13625 [Devosia sp. Root413D1]
MARNIWLFVVSLFIGPAIGALVFFAFAAITDGIIVHAAGQSASNFLGENWPIILIAAYTLGAIPAAISSVIIMLVSRFLPQLWQRLVAGPVIGALVSAAVIGLFLFSDDVSSVDDVIIISGVALTGAVSAFCCVGLIELWHPLPKRSAPVT